MECVGDLCHLAARARSASDDKADRQKILRPSCHLRILKNVARGDALLREKNHEPLVSSLIAQIRIGAAPYA
jgi:hypothetical protein